MWRLSRRWRWSTYPTSTYIKMESQTWIRHMRVPCDDMHLSVVRKCICNTQQAFNGWLGMTSYWAWDREMCTKWQEATPIHHWIVLFPHVTLVSNTICTYTTTAVESYFEESAERRRFQQLFLDSCSIMQRLLSLLLPFWLTAQWFFLRIQFQLLGRALHPLKNTCPHPALHSNLKQASHTISFWHSCKPNFEEVFCMRHWQSSLCNFETTGSANKAKFASASRW